MTIRTKLINRRYRLERRLSLNDATETWLGFDNVLHRAVAVTVPRQEQLRNAPFLAEFLQRSRIATSLHHRGIVAAFDSGEDGDTPYLVTEYVGGEELTDIIRNEAPFDVDDVAILIEQLAGALDYAHQRGFVHGQLNTTQVVVDGQGAAKLLGLGLPSGSTTWKAQNPLSFDDDVQALAAIAFEMLTGEQPDIDENDVAGAAYLLYPDIPRNASDIVAIGLGAGPTRFSSAGAFARSLTSWQSFDPGAYYVAPAPQPEEFPADLSYGDFNRSSLPIPVLDPWPVDDDFIGPTQETHRASNRSVRVALVAALVLALVAGILVWHSSEVVAGPGAALPVQLQSLAELTGF